MRRPLVGWLSAEAISLTGTRVSMIAIPWFVLTTTGSVTQTGLVAFAELTPMVVLKVLGGPLIDRLGPRRVAVTCDLGSTVAVGLIPVLHLTGLLSFAALLVLVALAGALRGPGDSAKDALVPSITASAVVSTERVTGLQGSVERTAGALGAAAGGLLIAAIGPANALVVDAASFLVSATVLAWSTAGLARAGGESGPEREDLTSYREQLAQGWRFLRHDPLLLGLSLMVAVTNLLDLGWTAVLLPVWAEDAGRGTAAIGLVLATFAGASILGSLLAAGWGERLPRYRVYVIAFALAGLPRFGAFALEAPVWALLVVMTVGGFSSGFLNPILGAVSFERIPAGLVGRVRSLSTAMAFALMPFGGLLAGALVAGFGLDPALLVVGVAYLLVTVGPALVVPAYRQLDRRPATVRVR